MSEDREERGVRDVAPSKDTEHLLSVKEAAEFLNFPIRRVYRYMKIPVNSGGIPHMRFEGTLRVFKRDLLDWCERHRVRFIGKTPKRR